MSFCQDKAASRHSTSRTLTAEDLFACGVLPFPGPMLYLMLCLPTTYYKETFMENWDTVITVHDGGYNQARRILEPLGSVSRTEYYNILVMRSNDPRRLLDGLLEEAKREPGSVSCLARVMPVTVTFTFQNPEQFEDSARQAVNAFLPDLGGKSFHLRMHRRGFKGRLSGMEEEKFLDTYLLDALQEAGNPGKISFQQPDAVIALETVGQRAGLALWTREDLERYPLLHVD
jgi:tRNA(Ser,Leu) C12 N-acetylase TAN1